ncbi:DNA-binding helix-turn-helix protein [Providencia rettgeri DSM 1131]|uniref:helix-turn-helix domain-containing protein n=1 Tax=Providencia rettgeri TaxID=587 RepID=UPI000197BB30|nr:helix-turn-helix transcriptional regulator [Providencia rettgeri]EFE55234.1 DNA-binding helix-turn-helix protein [Providencia rettgeri DSM 1131]QXA59580.1 helix-turn-helix domain-containing protein [Providencia rettgeri]
MLKINSPSFPTQNWVSTVTGQFLKEQRLMMGLSGEALAKKMQLSQQQISRYERGMTHINLTTLLRYFSVLNMDVREIQYFFELIVSWNEEVKEIHQRNIRRHYSHRG